MVFCQSRYRRRTIPTIALADRPYQFCVNEIEDIFSFPEHEDLRDSIRLIGKAETSTDDTVVLYFLMNSKPMCIAKIIPNAFTRRGVLTAA